MNIIKLFYFIRLERIRNELTYNPEKVFENTLLLKKIDEVLSLPEKNITVKALRNLIKDYKAYNLKGLSYEDKINRLYIKELKLLMRKLEARDMRHSFQEDTIKEIKNLLEKGSVDNKKANELILKHRKKEFEFHKHEKNNQQILRAESGYFFSCFWTSFIFPFFSSVLPNDTFIAAITLITWLASTTVYHLFSKDKVIFNKIIKYIKYIIMFPVFLSSLGAYLFLSSDWRFELMVVIQGLIIAMCSGMDIFEFLKDKSELSGEYIDGDEKYDD